MKIKNVHIFGGGTVAHIASHFAVCAPAYGATANKLYDLAYDKFVDSKVHLHLTKMAGGEDRELETNSDVWKKINELKADFNTKVIFFSCALVDWQPQYVKINDTIQKLKGKHGMRFDTHTYSSIDVAYMSADKIIPTIRDGRKDIFLVGFKTTCGDSRQDMFLKGLRLCKEASVNLVFVNDVKTRFNMVVTPEEAAYHEGTDRDAALKGLVEMAYLRSQLTFTQSTVVKGNIIPWHSYLVPNSLRTVVDYCVNKRAYKVFNGATVGHFATKLSDTEFLTSIRKSDFNKLKENGLVYVETDGPDTVLAYGAKPSVGGQSQRIVFRDHPGYDCIVHFHCPLRHNHPDDIPVASQREVECGSHQCGKNTSDNLKKFGNLKAVYLDKHGPNIVFPKTIDPWEVIEFINRNFDLDLKTGGYNL